MRDTFTVPTIKPYARSVTVDHVSTTLGLGVGSHSVDGRGLSSPSARNIANYDADIGPDSDNPDRLGNPGFHDHGGNPATVTDRPSHIPGVDDDSGNVTDEYGDAFKEGWRDPSGSGRQPGGGGGGGGSTPGSGPADAGPGDAGPGEPGPGGDVSSPGAGPDVGSVPGGPGPGGEGGWSSYPGQEGGMWGGQDTDTDKRTWGKWGKSTCINWLGQTVPCTRWFWNEEGQKCFEAWLGCCPDAVQLPTFTCCRGIGPGLGYWTHESWADNCCQWAKDNGPCGDKSRRW